MATAEQNRLKIEIIDDFFALSSPSGLLPSGSLPEGLFCVRTASRHKFAKRKKAPPANCRRAEDQRGSELKNNNF